MPKDDKKKTTQRGQPSRSEIEERIDRLLFPAKYESDPTPKWETEGTNADVQITIDDLVNMRPAKMEDLKVMIAFRAPTFIKRAVKRIQERSGSVYDIESDLTRDIFYRGLIFLAQQYEDILAGEIIIDRSQKRLQLFKDIEDQVKRLGDTLVRQPVEDQRADYLAFMEMVKKRPQKLQLHYIREIENNSLLAELRRRMIEQAKREEEDA